MEKINYNDLYTDTDINTGEDIFYIDSELKTPFTGVVVDFFKGILSWEFDVRNGYRNGKERKTFVDTIYYNEAGNCICKDSIDKNDIGYFLIANKINEYRNKYRLEG